MLANDAKETAERLLSGFCDTVVRLDHQLCIAKAQPQLLHLLSPSVLLNPDMLKGLPFESVLATQQDTANFSAFISSSSCYPHHMGEDKEGTAQALRINLKYEDRAEVSVELFHVHSRGHAEHVIGLREVRIECDCPDESLFQGSGSSSTPALLHDNHHNIKPEGGRRSKKSRSSRSSNNSGHSSRTRKRKLMEVDTVHLMFDMDMRILRYGICFDTSGRVPGLTSCLFGESGVSFVKWLMQGTNILLSEDEPSACLEYSDELMFRHPTAMCVDSSVLLCAESIKLNMVDVAGLGDDDPEDVSEPPVVFDLHLRGISQVTRERTIASISYNELSALYEAKDAE
jgi:hypothetical protein